MSKKSTTPPPVELTNKEKYLALQKKREELIKQKEDKEKAKNSGHKN